MGTFGTASTHTVETMVNYVYFAVKDDTIASLNKFVKGQCAVFQRAGIRRATFVIAKASGVYPGFVTFRAALNDDSAITYNEDMILRDVEPAMAY